MPLSRRYTSERFWKEAHRGVFYDVNDPVHVERFQIMRRVQEDAVGLMFDLVSESYMEPIVTNLDPTAGNYSTIAGNYTAATKKITITMNSPFTSDDLGKGIMFRSGANIYPASIATFIDADEITIRGDNLPGGDVAVDVLLMAATTLVGSDGIDLSGVEFMRVGSQVKIRVTSDITNYVRFLPQEEFWEWDPADDTHTIVCTLVGDSLYLQKGLGLNSFGSLALWLPRVPIAPTLNAEKMDLPDGPMIRVGLLLTYKEIRRRKGLPPEDISKELLEVVKMLYVQFNRQAELETITDKIKAVA